MLFQNLESVIEILPLRLSHCFHEMYLLIEPFYIRELCLPCVVHFYLSLCSFTAASRWFWLRCSGGLWSLWRSGVSPAVTDMALSLFLAIDDALITEGVLLGMRSGPADWTLGLLDKFLLLKAMVVRGVCKCCGFFCCWDRNWLPSMDDAGSRVSQVWPLSRSFSVSFL